MSNIYGFESKNFNPASINDAESRLSFPGNPNATLPPHSRGAMILAVAPAARVPAPSPWTSGGPALLATAVLMADAMLLTMVTVISVSTGVAAEERLSYEALCDPRGGAPVWCGRCAAPVISGRWRLS